MRWLFGGDASKQEAVATPIEAASILRRARRLRFRVRPETASALAGAYHGARPGIGLTFSELRAYEPGDDVRYLDWNVTARQGRPYVRRFVEERALTLWLALDVSASMRFGREAQTKGDRAAQCAALLAAAAVQNGDRAGLLLASNAIEFELRPGSGLRHLSRLLRALIAKPTSSPRSDLSAVLSRVRRAKRRVLLVVLSDFLSLGETAQWRAAAARHDVVALRVVDPLELVLPPVGLLRLQDAESRRGIVIDARSTRVRERYEHAAEERAEAFTHWCRETGVHGLSILTSEEPIGPLLRFLRGRSPARGHGRL